MTRKLYISLSLTILIGMAVMSSVSGSGLDWMKISQTSGEPPLTFTHSWLDAQNHGGIIYFLNQSPAQIDRYDLTSEGWISSIALSSIPTAFTIDGSAIYIGFGTSVSKFNLDGTGEVPLLTTDTDIQSLHVTDYYLYVNYSDYPYGKFASINKTTGALIDTESYTYDVLQGVSLAPSLGYLFGRDQGISPSDIVQITLNPDGTLGSSMDSPYHGDFPYATETFVLPGEAYVADNSGIVYNTSDLTYANSLAGSFDDMTFDNESIILLRDNVLIAHNNLFLETGRYTPSNPPGGIFVNDEKVYSFFDGASGIDVEIIPLNLFESESPGIPVDPNGLVYTPDEIKFGVGEIVYLLSKSHLSVFRWSVPDRAYLETIPLVYEPSYMAYSSELNRLYLAYESGKVTQIKLDESFSEVPLLNSPQMPCGLSTAGEYVFLCDPSGAWQSHFTYSPEGSLISQVEWNYYSHEYVWNSTNRKMYHFSDGSSPNDLYWEDIDEDGVIGAQQDSPYHSSEGIVHPIRVAPDGSIVVLGSGRIYNAISLEHINSLSNTISDGVWRNGTLFTLRSMGSGSQVQKWNSVFGVDIAKSIMGGPLRLFPISEGILSITFVHDRPWFSIWSEDLELIHPHFIFLPCVLNGACRPWFSDNFSDPESGWPISSSDDAELEYLEGEYRILIKYSNWTAAATPGVAATDFAAVVDVRNHSGINGSYGFIFGISDTWDQFYTYEIDTDGYYMIFKYSSSGWTLLTSGFSSSIHSGTATNRLKVVREASNITIYANGTLLVTISDSSYLGSRRIGLIASSYCQGNVDARFDEFAIYSSSCASQANSFEGQLGIPGSSEGRSSENLWMIGPRTGRD